MLDCIYGGVTRWFPYFAGFTEFTPTVPKLYWDVESQEQRILALCKQLHKLICYIDYVGDKVVINHEEIEKLKYDLQKREAYCADLERKNQELSACAGK